MSTSDQPPFSRRQFVGAGGVGLSAAAAALAFAQNSPQAPTQASAAETLDDPRAK
jgi:hypothetical protein